VYERTNRERHGRRTDDNEIRYLYQWKLMYRIIFRYIVGTSIEYRVYYYSVVTVQ
jgi:hypothetical protein